jgi:hypothetical protein
MKKSNFNKPYNFETLPDKIGSKDNIIENLRMTQSMRNSKYFHPHLTNQTKKQFWIDPIRNFFRKSKNKINFAGFLILMVNLFIIMEFSLKIESLWGLSSIGKFYVLLYIADVIGAVLSLVFLSKFSRSLLNKIHTAVIMILSLILIITSLSKVLSSALEIFLLSNFF